MKLLYRIRLSDEPGAYAILFAIIIVAILSMAALAVDISSATAQVRGNQTRADFAAMAAGSKLPGDPLGACNEAWKFILANTPGIPSKAVSPCASGVPAAFNPVCNASTPAVAYQATKVAPTFQITFTYPVPSADPLMQSRVGPPSVDGTDAERCQRMGVSIRTNIPSFFAGIFHASSLSSPADAVVRARQVGEVKVPVALLVLDPYGCNALLNSGQGGTYVYAADANTPGYISLDSDGTKSSNPNTCLQGQNWTIDASGTTNPAIKACANLFDPANPTNCTQPGVIDLYAYSSGQTTCDNGNPLACQQSDVDNGNLYPEPQQEFYRATVLPAYRRWNCRGAGVPYPQYQPYSNLPPVPIGDCDHSDANDSAAPYIDNLKTALGTLGQKPAGYCDITVAPAAGCPAIPNYPNGIPKGNNGTCSLSSSNPAVNAPTANWWINCPKGFTTSTPVTFATGSNVVVEDNFSTGSSTGSLLLNSSTAATCASTQPNVTMFFRGTGSFSKDAQSSVTLCHTMVYITGAPVSGGSTPPNMSFGAGSGSLTWVAPLGGQFNGLALWSDGIYSHGLGGQSHLDVEGVFFTPFADPFTFTGQPGINQTQAQFVTFRMWITGQGSLIMVPNPQNALLVKKFGWSLIR